MPTLIPAISARKQLGSLLERVYYQGQQFQITRKDKPMARLVGEPFIQAIEKLIESDEMLADTLAILLDQEISGDIRQSRQEYQEGRAVRVEDVLKSL
jgi:antitoxin (DNA-binding transcriptional repressor) of toxin-antitoxin stability system